MYHKTKCVTRIPFKVTSLLNYFLLNYPSFLNHFQDQPTSSRMSHSNVIYVTDINQLAPSECSHLTSTHRYHRIEDDAIAYSFLTIIREEDEEELPPPSYEEVLRGKLI